MFDELKLLFRHRIPHLLAAGRLHCVVQFEHVQHSYGKLKKVPWTLLFHSGLDDVCDQESQCQGKGRDNFKVNECPKADNAGLLEIARLRYSAGDRNKHDRSDDHLHQSEKDIWQEFQIDGDGRKVVPEGDA